MTTASAAYFEQVADQWDTLRAGYFQEAVREAAIANAYLRPEMEVADIGGGTGFMAAGLAPLVSRVYVLDGSAAMLDVARRNLAGFDNVDFQQTDGEALPAARRQPGRRLRQHVPAPLPRPAGRHPGDGARAAAGRAAGDHRHGCPRHDWMREEMADEWLGFDRGQIKAWLREAGAGQRDRGLHGPVVLRALGDRRPSDAAQISVFVATGSRRVAGAREVVQASYGAVAAGSGRLRQRLLQLQQRAAIAAAIGQACRSLQQLLLACCAPANAMPEIAAAPGPGDLLWNTGYSRRPVGRRSRRGGGDLPGLRQPDGTGVAQAGRGRARHRQRRRHRRLLRRPAGRPGRPGHRHGHDAGDDRAGAPRRPREAGLSQVEFRLGQAEAMPVEDGTVDVILSNCVINLCEDKGKVFEEAYRVLQAGRAAGDQRHGDRRRAADERAQRRRALGRLRPRRAARAGVPGTGAGGRIRRRPCHPQPERRRHRGRGVYSVRYRRARDDAQTARRPTSLRGRPLTRPAVARGRDPSNPLKAIKAVPQNSLPVACHSEIPMPRGRMRPHK